MSHPVIEGTVKLLKIVTPGAYWISCKACEGSCRIPTSSRHKPHPDEYYYPPQGAKVFVHDEDGFFYRGTICGRRIVPKSHQWKYVVQYTDTFQVKDIAQQNIYPSYGPSAACESAHLVSLYHVLPRMPPATYGKAVKVGTDEHKTFEKVVTEWDLCLASTAHLTEDNLKFSFVQSKLINGSVYGQLSISPPLLARDGTSCYSLTDYIITEKLAQKITFRFEEVVGALMANTLIDNSQFMPTFDPYGKAISKLVAASHHDTPPEPADQDFSGFSVHPDDFALHQSISDELFHSINILFTGAPLKHDPIIRYVSPHGNIVLGTVLNIDVKACEVVPENLGLGNSYCQNFPYSHNINMTNEQSVYYSDKFFEKLPPEISDFSNESEISLLSYDFDETCRHFRSYGGIFEEPLLPYPYSPAVEKFIVQQLEALGIESLHDWQKLCLPTFSCRKNLLVLGGKSMGKLTMSTISALSWMSSIEDSNSINPMLIIFFSDFDRADKTASLCTRLTDFRVIVSTSSFISEKQKEIAKNGCDILITTPSNWAKLVSQTVFGYSRLNHVIFDEFHQLQELYSEDLESIFDALESSSSRRVQTVVAANSWGSFIGNYMKRAEFATVCVTDVLLSCLYYNLTPTAVFVKRNDCSKHLENIITRKLEQKRLLLCKDETEGKSIIEKILHVQRVLFIHENLSSDTALKIVSEWERRRSTLLVCTDGCFKQLHFVKDVDVMISWMTSSRNTLSSRFMAYKDVPSYQKGISWASAYLFCDCENLDELVLIKSISNNLNFINGTLDEHMSSATTIAERGKPGCICPSVFMFGNCNNVPVCTNRHVFLPHDEPELFDQTLFLKVSILKVHSAFRYSVRVREVISNYDHKISKNQVSLISKLEEIECGLLKSSKKPSPPRKLKEGQMFGARIDREDSSLLRRVKVKFVPEDGSSDLCILGIVDFEEPDVYLPVSQLFILPEEVAKYPKDLIDLYIAGIMPADFKSDWRNDTYNYVTAAMKEIIKEWDFLAGKVEIITANRCVLVDSLHRFEQFSHLQSIARSISDSEYCCLKDLILESGYCIKNLAHLPSLSELGVGRGLVPSNLEGRFGFRTDLPINPELAVVSSYDDPGLLYVQIKAESEKLESFENLLSSTLRRSKQKLRLIALHELCAVENHGAWNRAMILQMTGGLETPVNIVFVDYGDTLQVQPDALYCLPDGYADVPFFAIECELVGIKPLRGEEWNRQSIEEFESHIRTCDDTMKDVLVKFCGIKNGDQSSSYFWRHMAVLSELHDPELSINYHLARQGFARFDPNTRNLLKSPLMNGIITNGLARPQRLRTQNRNVAIKK